MGYPTLYFNNERAAVDLEVMQMHHNKRVNLMTALARPSRGNASFHMTGNVNLKTFPLYFHLRTYAKSTQFASYGLNSE